jgi:hypothetical protein
MNRWSAGVVLVTLAIAGMARADDIPDKVRNSTWIYVTTSYGDTEGENLSPTSEDRRAVAAFEDQMRSWLRFKTVNAAKKADLIFVVRTGRRKVPGSPQVTIGNDPRQRTPGSGLPPISGPFPGSPKIGGPTSTDDESRDDYLLVFDANALDSAPPLWQKHMRNGYGPDMALFRAFKKEVENSKP